MVTLAVVTDASYAAMALVTSVSVGLLPNDVFPEYVPVSGR